MLGSNKVNQMRRRISFALSLVSLLLVPLFAFAALPAFDDKNFTDETTRVFADQIDYRVADMDSLSRSVVDFVRGVLELGNQEAIDHLEKNKPFLDQIADTEYRAFWYEVVHTASVFRFYRDCRERSVYWPGTRFVSVDAQCKSRVDTIVSGEGSESIDHSTYLRLLRNCRHPNDALMHLNRQAQAYLHARYSQHYSCK